ncbi:unnamed protein product [Sphagnum troendelagicum]
MMMRMMLMERKGAKSDLKIQAENPNDDFTSKPELEAMFDIQAQASKQLNEFGKQLPSDTKLKSSAQNKSCMEQ